MNNKSIKSIIWVLSAIIVSSLLGGVAAYADEVPQQDTENIFDRNFGYEEPEEFPYNFADDGEQAAEGKIEIVRSQKFNVLKSSVEEVFASPAERRYITSVPSYSGGGTVPAIADTLKADNQQKTGLCWVYATNKAMEANLYLNGVSTDLSEKNTAYYFWNKADTSGSEGDALRNAYNYMTYAGNGTSPIISGRESYGRGGNTVYLDNYLAAWKGVVTDSGNNKFDQNVIANESLMYGSASSMTVPTASDVYSSTIGHVRNIYRAPATDSDAIKTLIKKYGAVSGAVNASSLYVKYNTCAWYNPMDSSINHQITILGWDDDYDRNNFKGYITETYGKPKNNGAWYCMNSWGEGAECCDANGGFWISYEDKAFSLNTRVCTAFDMAKKGTDEFYDHNYIAASASSLQTTFLYAGSDNTCGMSYKATGLRNSSGFEQVRAVGFSTFDADTKWTIRGYKGANPAEGILVSEQTVTLPYVGYHTVNLMTPFKVKEGESFYIEIQPAVSGADYSVNCAYAGKTTTLSYTSGVDYNGKSYQYKATAKYGIAYGTSYVNRKAQTAESDGTILQILLHAYTDDCGSPEYSTLTSSNLTATFNGEANYRLSDYYSFTSGKDDAGKATTIKSVTSSDETVAVADLAGDKITVKKSGTAKITVTASDLVKTEIAVTSSKYAITDSSVAVTGINSTYTYDGKQKKPSVTVKAGSRTLTRGTDYTVSYGTNINAGTGTVKITGAGNYSGSTTKAFTIAAREIKTDDISGIDALYGYTGSAVNPEPTITADGNELIKDTDYTVSYGENIAIGAGSVRVQGRGNYSGTVDLNFEIRNTVVKSVLTAKERKTAEFGVTVNYNINSLMSFTPGKDGEGNDTVISTVSSDNTDVAIIKKTNTGTYVRLHDNGTLLSVGVANIRYTTNDGVTASTRVTVLPASIRDTSARTLTLERAYSYNGEDVTVSPEIRYNNTADTYYLTEGKDYTLRYNSNNAPGYASVTIKGSGNFDEDTSVIKYFYITAPSSFTDTASKSFTYRKGKTVSLNDILTFVPGAEIDETVENPAVGNGNGVKDTCVEAVASGDETILKVIDNDTIRIEKTGETTVTVTTDDGKDATVEVKVVTGDINDAEISGLKDSYTWTGEAITPGVTVKDNGNILEKDRDYTVDYSYCTDAGTGMVAVNGIGEYVGTKEAGYTITQADIDDATVSGLESSYAYTGAEIRPEMTVKYGNRILFEGEDYDTGYTNNIEAGTATFTLTGKKNLTGTYSGTFRIKKSGGSEDPEEEGTLQATLDVPAKGAVYTGEEIKPEVTVKLVKKVSTETIGSGLYGVSYKNNINVGNATATITMSGAYGGEIIRKSFTIIPAKVTSTAIGGIMKSYVYAGKPVVPALTVTYNGKTLTEGTDYTAEYSDNNAPGTATYILTGMNNFTGTREGKYTINAEPTGEEEIEDPVNPEPDPDPKDPDPVDPTPDPVNPDPGPENEEAKEQQETPAEPVITVSDNMPMDIRTEQKGEYEVTYAHEVPFWGKSKIGPEFFGGITISHNGAEYKVTKIKVNKKKGLIQVTGLSGADKQTEKAVKKATKGSGGLKFDTNPYYVRKTDSVAIKTRKNGSVKSVSVTINGKAYKAKKTEYSYDASAGKIIFSGNLAGSYGGNEEGTTATASIGTVETDFDTDMVCISMESTEPERMEETKETKENGMITDNPEENPDAEELKREDSGLEESKVEISLGDEGIPGTDERDKVEETDNSGSNESDPESPEETR